MRKVLLFAAVTAITFLYSCKTTVSDDDGVLQITQDDVIELEGDLDDNFLSGWDYIVLDNKEIQSIIPGDVVRILYDDGLYFIGGSDKGGFLKVFDSNGHYLNDISRLGRARNEFLSLNEWTIDHNRNEVLITTLDVSGSSKSVLIKKYDYQGNYLGELNTDSLGEGALFGNLRKCLSDGTLLIQNSFNPFPIYDYLFIPQKGNAIHPFEITQESLALRGVPDEELESMKKWSQDFSYDIFFGSYNQLSDTTYTMRLFDNHIYRITKESSDCIANLLFRPQMQKKEKKIFNPQTGPFATLPFYIIDLKDYLCIWYYDGKDCVYEKSTSKVYELNGNSPKTLLPGYTYCSIYGNDMIACVDEGEISRANKLIESDDYDHRYSPELEDFYRKIKDCQNPVIFIAHYDKK